MNAIVGTIVNSSQGFGINARGRAETTGECQASANFTENLSALADCAPDLAHELSQTTTSLTWTFGRDGYLTARDETGWWTGCSVPLQTGRELLKSLEMTGAAGCFVLPSHAGQLRACFERINTTQAVIAIVPDLLNLSIILHCDDFSMEIRSRRLSFVTGADWPARLSELYDDLPGLPIPQQFIRTALLEDAEMNRIIPEAQGIFSKVTNQRAELLAKIAAGDESQSQLADATVASNRGVVAAGIAHHRTGRICVVAPSQFKLWSFAGVALHEALREIDPAEENLASEAINFTPAKVFCPLDTDNPIYSSPMALAIAARDADAIVTADLYRADFPPLAPLTKPWITWVTKSRIAGPNPDAADDAVLVSDVRFIPLCQDAGWHLDHIHVAGWPLTFRKPKPGGFHVGLIVDTVKLEMPEKLRERSSQGLLWELVAAELGREPLRLDDDADEYLSTCMAKLELTDEHIDRAWFIDQLVFPAYHQGVARLLIRERVPMLLFGNNWSQIDEFLDFTGGPITSPADLREALSQCGCLIQPWPMTQTHPIHALEIPIVSPAGKTVRSFIEKARQAKDSVWHGVANCKTPLNPGRLCSAIRGMRFASPNEASHRPAAMDRDSD
jgi:hypothetical protein